MLQMTLKTIATMMMLTIPQIVNAAQLERQESIELLRQPATLVVQEIPLYNNDLGLLKKRIIYSKEELLTYEKKGCSPEEVEDFLKKLVDSSKAQNASIDDYINILIPELRDQFWVLYSLK